MAAWRRTSRLQRRSSRQLETAKAEVTKPFAQEAELAQKLERLSALNALLNMDEKGSDALSMDDATWEEDEGQEETFPEKPETGENTADADAPIPYPVENARHNYAVDDGNPQGLKLVAAMADKPVQRTSLKEKLEAFKVKAAGAEKQENHKEKGKEVTM